MDKNIIMLISIFGSVIPITIIWLLVEIYFIMPKNLKRINKMIKEEEAKREQIKLKLNERLVNFCTMFKISLEYKNDLGKAAGHILYHKDKSGRLLLDDCKIEVLEKYKLEPWVLAHELGHYIAINKLQNNSEEMAEQCAGELCCMFLSEQEQKYLAISLDSYFGYKVVA